MPWISRGWVVAAIVIAVFIMFVVQGAQLGMFGTMFDPILQMFGLGSPGAAGGFRR